MKKRLTLIAVLTGLCVLVSGCLVINVRKTETPKKPEPKPAVGATVVIEE